MTGVVNRGGTDGCMVGCEVTAERQQGTEISDIRIWKGFDLVS